MDIGQLIEDFELLGDWEERYRYVIELGRTLPLFPEHNHLDEHKVHGCASQVWLVFDGVSETKTPPVISFIGDSDALIVRGLIAILHTAYNGQSATSVLALDIESIMKKLGLDEHLSQQRSNGFKSMIGHIRREAAQLTA